jgi:hypothetical protein
MFEVLFICPRSWRATKLSGGSPSRTLSRALCWPRPRNLAARCPGTAARSELGLGTRPSRPRVFMPRSTSRQKPEPWRSARLSAPALAGSARVDRLSTLAVAIMLCGVQKSPPGLGGHLRLERHIFTGATLRIKCCVPHLMRENRTSGLRRRQAFHWAPPPARPVERSVKGSERCKSSVGRRSRTPPIRAWL